MICILQLIDQFLLRSRAVLATTSDDYIYIYNICLEYIHLLQAWVTTQIENCSVHNFMFNGTDVSEFL